MSAVPFPVTSTVLPPASNGPSASIHQSPVPSSAPPPLCPTATHDFDYTPFSSSTPTHSPFHKLSDVQTPDRERPSQPHTPLNPPLTPASADNPTDALSTPALSNAPPPTPSSAGLLAAAQSNRPAVGGPPLSPVAVGAWGSVSTTASTTTFDSSYDASPTIDLGERDVQPLLATTGNMSAESDGDRVVLNLWEDPSAPRESSGGERYLLVGNVPKNASNEELERAFRPYGDIKGLCLPTEGLVIVAFYDSRHTLHAEHQLSSNYPAFGPNTQLRTERISAAKLRSLMGVMGDSSFVDDSEGDMLVSTEGKMEASSLQSLVSGFGGLHSFKQASSRLANAASSAFSPDSPIYVAEFYDCREAKRAQANLHDRSFFGIRIKMHPLHKFVSPSSSTAAAASRTPFLDDSAHVRAATRSQPTSPLKASFHRDREEAHAHPTNVSPFNTTHPLPSGDLCTSGGFANVNSENVVDISSNNHSGAARRISTGSVRRTQPLNVNIPSLGSIPGVSSLVFPNSNAADRHGHLHQSTSEQDLRRRAAANVSANFTAGLGSPRPIRSELGDWGNASLASNLSAGGDHMRRTSDTFCFDALKRATGNLSGTGSGAGGGYPLTLDGLNGFGRVGARTRAISESSASPRLISPSENSAFAFSLTSNFGQEPQDERQSSTASTPLGFGDNSERSSHSQEQHDHISSSPSDSYAHSSADTGYLHPKASFSSDGGGGDRMRYPTVSDSSAGGPHTPPPPPGSGSSGTNASMYGVPAPGSYYASPSAPGTGPHLGMDMSMGGMPMGVGPVGMGLMSPMLAPTQPPHPSPYYLAASTSPRFAFPSSGHAYAPGAPYGSQSAMGGCSSPEPLFIEHLPTNMRPLSSPNHHQTSFHAPFSSPGSSFSQGRSYGHEHGHGHGLGHGPGGHRLPAAARSALDVTRDAPPERNQVDLDRIEAGLDTRTTVMIKNIPNKLSDRDLIEYIGRVCPRKIDFLYLRMDFQNGCNVGYAFVNFIHVEDLLLFAKEKLGVRWNMFSSEKVLQMSYANYQGKEALVEKFKNSCVMDEREAWRPKIFYSSGPNQGLPEPFPAPTHFRRKERSAQNRGALFVPANGPGGGSGGGGAGSGGLGGGWPLRRPHQHPQNLSRERY